MVSVFNAVLFFCAKEISDLGQNTHNVAEKYLNDFFENRNNKIFCRSLVETLEDVSQKTLLCAIDLRKHIPEFEPEYNEILEKLTNLIGNNNCHYANKTKEDSDRASSEETVFYNPKNVGASDHELIYTPSQNDCFAASTVTALTHVSQDLELEAEPHFTDSSRSSPDGKNIQVTRHNGTIQESGKNDSDQEELYKVIREEKFIPSTPLRKGRKKTEDTKALEAYRKLIEDSDDYSSSLYSNDIGDLNELYDNAELLNKTSTMYSEDKKKFGITKELHIQIKQLDKKEFNVKKLPKNKREAIAIDRLCNLSTVLRKRRQFPSSRLDRSAKTTRLPLNSSESSECSDFNTSLSTVVTQQ
ncbi:uncharacterized protein LOC132702024 isoform X2 [Cylas formicarius]|uniref:uncharacterized protein LOC132702024 isoform X2 n=1 Tax=Cylas formicarius TaxID=197179 RepID=UPI0029585DDF|nr:uncharacterized protein LOC132702024 isoform X2 [Cylas formicarius]